MVYTKVMVYEYFSKIYRIYFNDATKSWLGFFQSLNEFRYFVAACEEACLKKEISRKIKDHF